jgi:hypothetical protein
MGHLFESAGLTNPNTALQSAGGSPSFIGSPSQVLSKANAGLPSADAMMGPDVLNPNQQPPKLPTIGKPSFIQAVMGGPQTSGGMPVSPLENPSLSKGGKLLQILGMAGQGMLAGRAAQEQATVQSGGRRSGGVGMAMEAGYSLPFLRALQSQQAQQGQAETQLLQSQAQNAPLLQRLGILKAQTDIQKGQAETEKDQYVTPRSGGVYDIKSGQFAPGTEPQDKAATIDTLLAQAAQKAQSEGRDPRQDPQVQQLSDVKTSLQREAQPKTQNDFEQYYSSWLKDSKQPDTAANRLAAHKQWEIKPQQPGTGDARLDRSYQFNSTQLEKLGQPIDDAVRRMGRLQDTLSQNSPQADALVAPELLTVMAGGAGSGLRMNEAEISRIVGGRSNWESLKAAANKWSLDPKTANSITAAQRQQIRALVSTVQQKLQGKQSALDEAHEALINATDPVGHRRVVAGARSKMTAIDQGGQGGQGGGEPSGKAVSLAAAKQLPAMKGKSDEEIRQAIQASGHQVIP